MMYYLLLLLFFVCGVLFRDEWKRKKERKNDRTVFWERKFLPSFEVLLVVLCFKRTNESNESNASNLFECISRMNLEWIKITFLLFENDFFKFPKKNEWKIIESRIPQLVELLRFCDLAILGEVCTTYVSCLCCGTMKSNTHNDDDDVINRFDNFLAKMPPH